ncbi:hypothetical protein HYV50_01120 [Candidatus Pacearchaeota archaeon]|nr:hypothetical protein [Candidatus Pacearchaeota archaeon]
MEIENKKAQLGSQMMIFAFIFLLLIAGIGIVTGIYIFFSSEYDFRQIDAEILNYGVNSCLQKKEINFNVPPQELENEILKKCALHKTVTDNYFLISIKNEADNKILLKLGKGDETRCGLAEKNTQFPKCTNSTVTLKINNNQQTLLILTGSNQNSRENLV